MNMKKINIDYNPLSTHRYPRDIWGKAIEDYMNRMMKEQRDNIINHIVDGDELDECNIFDEIDHPNLPLSFSEDSWIHVLENNNKVDE